MADALKPARDVIAELRRVDTDGKSKQAMVLKRAVAMYEDRQDSITRSELQRRFPSAFEGATAGQEMLPISIPLTRRFVIEQASAYRKPPRRYFCNEDGSESEPTKKQTDGLKRMLDDACFDATRMDNERFSVLLRSVGEWWGAKNGRLKVARVFPHHLLPVEAAGFGVDPCDPEDHLGYVVELAKRRSDSENLRNFVYVTPDADHYYRGTEQNTPQVIDHMEASPFEMEDGYNQHRITLLTDCHGETFIPETDAPLSEVNVELNVALSAIMDTIRFQGHAVPVKKLSNQSNPKALQRNGARFPVVLSLVESFDMISAATNYTDQINVLREIVRMMAVANSLPPSDVSTEAPSPQSGFAKLVESLPKLQAREDRIMKLTAHERQSDLPRLLAIGIYLGYLDESARAMDYRVEFPDVEYPRTEMERTQRMDTDIKYGLTSPAKILAKESGITKEQAEVEVEENREASGETGAAEMYGYHIESGAVRINEVRARIGLPPDPVDGDKTVPELKAEVDAKFAAGGGPVGSPQPPAFGGLGFGARIGRTRREEPPKTARGAE